MSAPLPFVSLPPASGSHTGSRGYALVVTMLMITVLAAIIMHYQMGNSRNSRTQIYFAMGQEFAGMARSAHVYVQDHAYFSPYITDATSAAQATRLAYFKALENNKIRTYRQPLLQQANAGENVITMTDLKKAPDTANSIMDSSIDFSHPVRKVQYTIRAHGGLVPLAAAAEVKAASALLVMYGRTTAGVPDPRSTADMAAFRAGAASNGLKRIGIVLPPAQRGDLPSCRNKPALVVWGNNASDCLSADDATAIGMTLDTFDVVAPAWESVEKQLNTTRLYRRPHPGMHGTNMMGVDLKMEGTTGKNNIMDAVEIYSGSINMDPTKTPGKLAVGKTTSSTQDTAMLIVGRSNNITSPSDKACTDAGSSASTCIKGAIAVSDNMAVFYRENPLKPSEPVPETLLKADGGVEVTLGDVVVNADDTNPKYAEKGVFDVTGGTGGSTFEINKQDENPDTGTIINKTVKVKNYALKSTEADEQYVVSDEIILHDSPIKVGTDATPSQVVFTKADLKTVNDDLKIDTTGKGAEAGVFSNTTEVDSLTQSDAAKPNKFKRITFQNGEGGTPPVKVTVKGALTVDPLAKHILNDCVGKACPDQATEGPGGTGGSGPF